MTERCFGVFAFFFCLAFLAHSQESPERHRYSVQTNYAPGGIIKHTKHLNSLDYFHVKSCYLDFSMQSDTNHPWARPHGYPSYGATLFFNAFKSSFIGYAAGIVPYIEKSVPLVSNRLSFTYHVGCGLGYAAQVYDAEHNPGNKTMSTHLNAAIDLRTGFTYSIWPTLDVRVEAGLFHLSNGAVKMPNYGANLLQLNTGLKYNFGSKVPVGKRQPQLQSPRFVLIANAGYRLLESTGSYYPVQNLLLECHLLNGKAHRLGLGVAVMNDAIRQEYDAWANYFGRGNHEQFTTRETLNYGPYLHYEFVLNRLSAYLHMGYYLAHPFHEFKTTIDYGYGFTTHYVELNRSVIFNRLGLRYRIMPHLLMNFSMKTHAFTAQYLEFGLGTYW